MSVPVDDTIESYHRLIKTDVITSAIRIINGQSYVCVVDDEGILKNRLPSAVNRDGRIDLVGAILILADDGDQWSSLTEEQIRSIRRRICYAKDNGGSVFPVVIVD